MHLAALLDQFARQPNKVALFRESGAQHYSGDGSIHTWADSHPDAAQQCHCKPLADVHEITQVTDLNAILRKLHRHHPRIGLLHYYDLTAPRFNMHEESFCAFGHGDTPVRCCDCVHFCYTPQMWKARAAANALIHSRTRAETARPHCCCSCRCAVPADLSSAVAPCPAESTASTPFAILPSPFRTRTHSDQCRRHVSSQSPPNYHSQVFFSEMYEQVSIHMVNNDGPHGLQRTARRRPRISPRRAARVEQEMRKASAK